MILLQINSVCYLSFLSSTKKDSWFFAHGGDALPSVKLDNIVPENWWLGDDPFFLGRLGLFSGANC